MSQSLISWIVFAAVTLFAANFISLETQIFSDEVRAHVAAIQMPLHRQEVLSDFTWITIRPDAAATRTFQDDLAGETYALSFILNHLTETSGLSITLTSDRIMEIDGVTGAWVIYRNNIPQVGPLDRMEVRGGERYEIRKISKP